MPIDAPLANVVEQQHIVVCCGTGGVGKTTTAAVFAIEAAKRGRNAVVVTIDPAKRLADTLGVNTLGHAVQEIDRRRWDPDGRRVARGRLSAVMLDTETTFDGLVVRYAKDARAGRAHPRQPLLPQHRRHARGDPGIHGDGEAARAPRGRRLRPHRRRHTTDAPRPRLPRRAEPVDPPPRQPRVPAAHDADARAYLRVASAAVQTFLRRVTKVVGAEVVDDVVAFFRAFEGMEQGFRDRAAAVAQLLGDASTTFVLVTSARRDSVNEAEFFADRLAESGLGVGALVVNRMLPRSRRRSRPRSATVRSRCARPTSSTCVVPPRPGGSRHASTTSPTSPRTRPGSGPNWPGWRTGSTPA